MKITVTNELAGFVEFIKITSKWILLLNVVTFMGDVCCSESVTQNDIQ